ncbi:MAG: porphobilinogen synthase [Rickettsiales bacterium]|nr:porphobilinogen synthase [Rickettsiales bacterium]
MINFFSRGFPYHRGRRLRQNQNFREIFSESNLSLNDLVMPYFLREEDDNPKIEGMPEVYRYNEEEIINELKNISNLGIKSIAIFPKVPDEKKSDEAEEALNNNNLICRALRKIKNKFPDLIVICDIALDSYTNSGHDGILDSAGQIDNDKTIKQLAKMAVSFASNGCDVVAPSDMMDGRVKIIRDALEKEKKINTCILSYSAKFCSNFYSPFREALGSKKNIGKSSKNTYQINFKNKHEAIKESLEDIQEGADIVMIKPAGYYLDIISELRKNCCVPIAAYQVSGEYSMIKIASKKKILNYKDSVLESLHCIKRSGADLIFSYFSKEVAEWMNK